ncbi:formate--tetrahydrofolate ligase [Ornithinimicrobium cerasi]|uniref:Formate--tetrahydrofolate ligase n=1 Tax=Ornithinimicrobium cerasi TaxID=2248773 RepID=A0A285VPQ6_9MICO|nr:formate--tetrahydrofolate ligase [Ornithinimicrobium cerasi]SOC56039.1 Formate-tetrahydrofolate ligase [Ornithinimicrobium cerasi]
MKSDIEIAQGATLRPIGEIAAGLGLSEAEYSPYGHDKAKISLSVLDRLADRPDGRLVLCTAINPTAAGEGKTTTNVGLSMALNRLGHRAITTLREPSLGPSFGMKGGAAGGGHAQVVPMDDINLHFTGDFHAITSAHNLLAALLDNSLHQGNPLGINPKRVTWPRVLDMNDRALRNVVIGLGKVGDGVVRESGFEITVASEIMAALCLATGLEDLKERFGRIVVAQTYDRRPVTAADLGAPGAMALLMKDAVRPNLVQTLENTPAIIHGGPFANIAHGNNSILATRTALKLADYVVTEAGFGADLGAEKFFDIVCPAGGLTPSAVVLVATVRALKLNGGRDRKELAEEDLDALGRGVVNLEQHLENLALFGVPAVVALNRFPTDTDAELDLVRRRCAELGVDVELSEVFTRGGEGGESLARKVVELCEQDSTFTPLYGPQDGVLEKIERIATRIYRADGVDLTGPARTQLAQLEAQGHGALPVCMAKTQYSFSDDPALLGAPRGFRITVRELVVNAGAGFVVALTGDIMRMPGLPKVPAAVGMDIAGDGTITGLS